MEKLATRIASALNVSEDRLNPNLVTEVAGMTESLPEVSDKMLHSAVMLWIAGHPGIPAVDSADYYADKQAKKVEGEYQSRLHSAEFAILERNTIIEESKRMIEHNEATYSRYEIDARAAAESQLAATLKENRELCDQSNVDFQSRIDQAESELPGLQKALEAIEKERG